MVTVKQINEANEKFWTPQTKLKRPQAGGSKPAQRKPQKSKFNPSSLTSTQTVKWIKEGDIEQASHLAQSLATFLHAYSDARPSLLALVGFMVTGDETVLLSALRAARANAPARAALVGLTAWMGTEEATLIAEAIARPASKAAGKRTESGIEQIAKMLVPGKPTKSRFSQRWIASVVDLNLDGKALKKELPNIVQFLNILIDQNNRILTDLSEKKTLNLNGYNPAIPKRHFTKDQLEKAYRATKPEIDKANGVIRQTIRHNKAT